MGENALLFYFGEASNPHFIWSLPKHLRVRTHTTKESFWWEMLYWQPFVCERLFNSMKFIIDPVFMKLMVA
jgi:hypothetical protein